MNRRALLAGVVACLGGTALGGTHQPRANAMAGAGYLTPTTNTRAVYAGGRWMLSDPGYRAALPAGWDREVTIVTRVDEDGAVRRGLLPVEKGHAVAVSPDRRLAVLTGQNGRHICTFDPVTLEPDRHVATHGPDSVAGGHAVFLPDGTALLVVERRAYVPYEGVPERHFGKVTVRDPATLAVLDTYSAHGIAPHEINLMADGHHVAIANYGTTAAADSEEGLPLIEPSLTVLDIRDGRLVHRWVPERPEYEMRHLAAYRADRIFVLQNRVRPLADVQALIGGPADAYASHVTKDGRVHAPAPVLRVELADTPSIRECLPAGGLAEIGRGQSIVYDPVHDEAIGTFRILDRVVVFDGDTGQVKHEIATDALGLLDPAGIDLHPDGAHYVVSGNLNGHYTFRRGTHELVPARSHDVLLYGHSHLTIA